MNIVLVIFLIILIRSAKFEAGGTFVKDYLSVEHTKEIKGVFVFLIICTHFVQYVETTDMSDGMYMSLRGHMGQMVVAMFLFYSGFGMVKSFLKKGYDYIPTIITRRLIRLFIHFAMAICCFMVVNLLLGNHYSWQQNLLAFTGWTSIGNSNWYVFCMFVIYLIMFTSFAALKHVNIKYAKWIGTCLTTVMIICYVYTCMKIKKETYWYNTAILFAAGMWYALLHERIERILFRSRQIYLGTVAVGSVFYMYFFKHRGASIERYSLWALSFVMMVLLLSMKVTLNSTILKWLGEHIFSVYILQRIPMLVLKRSGLVKGEMVLYFCVSMILLIVLVEVFEMLIRYADVLIFKGK